MSLQQSRSLRMVTPLNKYALLWHLESILAYLDSKFNKVFEEIKETELLKGTITCLLIGILRNQYPKRLQRTVVIPEVVTSVESQIITFGAVNTGTRSDVIDAFLKATSQNSARLVKPKDERLAKKSKPTEPTVSKHTVMI